MPALRTRCTERQPPARCIVDGRNGGGGGGGGATVCDTGRDVCAQMHRWIEQRHPATTCFVGFFLTQSCQSVPELDTGSHLAEIQLFLGDLNHFHIAKLTMGWGKISPNAGDAKPFGNPEAAT